MAGVFPPLPYLYAVPFQYFFLVFAVCPIAFWISVFLSFVAAPLFFSAAL